MSLDSFRSHKRLVMRCLCYTRSTYLYQLQTSDWFLNSVSSRKNNAQTPAFRLITMTLARPRGIRVLALELVLARPLE